MNNTNIEVIKLEFSSKNGSVLRFSSVEEFFETLGIICRKDKPVKIRSLKSQAHGGNFVMLDKNSKPVKIDTAITHHENALKLLSEGGRFVGVPGGYSLECSPTIYYTKAFYDRIKGNTPKADGSVSFGCIEYVEYLRENFNFSNNGFISEDGGGERLGDLECPHISDIKKIIGTNSAYIYFFEKGLYSDVKNN
jgi:hypothetical protein